MQIIVERGFPYEPRHAIRKALHSSSSNSLRLEVFRLNAWVEVTHETKNQVMAQVSEDDLKKVGCKNPDIYVNGKKDDRIVLTRPQTLRNEKGKSKKHVTSVRAGDIFGREWPDHLNILKLERLGHVHDQLKSDLSLKSILLERNAWVVFIKVAPSVYVAHVCH